MTLRKQFVCQFLDHQQCHEGLLLASLNNTNALRGWTGQNFM